MPLVVPAYAAGAFAKEHEQRTWQDVILTRLSAFEILSGKFFACLLPTLTTIIVLFPPFALMLIMQNIHWAMEPGPWMLIVGFKLLVSAAFYIAVVMVCSYHSANTRTALVIGYIALGLYAAFNYALWRFFLIPLFILPFWMENEQNNFHFDNFDRVAPWDVSRQQFSLNLVEILALAQAILLGFCLYLYLFSRLRRRT